MIKVILTSHKNSSDTDLKKIIALKSQHWQYSDQQQLEWINKNISSNDYHLKIENADDEVIAYLNLVEIIVSFEDISQESYLGIGNVCVDKHFKGKGLGLFLMQAANYYLKQLDKKGTLICKPQLHEFYIKSNWIKYDGEWTINGNLIDANIYFMESIYSNKLKINKNF